jgi:competence protein ComEC
LLASGVDLAADVLKVGHHGSRYATSQGLLSRVAPSQAIISVGARNPYRLPSVDVLRRLRKNGTEVWSTDRHGAVQVWTDGQELRVEAVQKRPARPKVAPVAVPEPSRE